MTPPTCRALGRALRRSPAPTSTPAQPEPQRSPSRRCRGGAGRRTSRPEDAERRARAPWAAWLIFDRGESYRRCVPHRPSGAEPSRETDFRKPFSVVALSLSWLARSSARSGFGPRSSRERQRYAAAPAGARAPRAARHPAPDARSQRAACLAKTCPNEKSPRPGRWCDHRPAGTRPSPDQKPRGAGAAPGTATGSRVLRQQVALYDRVIDRAMRGSAKRQRERLRRVESRPS